MILHQEINELEESLADLNKRKLSVSEKGVDWHVDHSLKVINGVCHALIKSVPEDYKWKFNIIRSYVFLTGYIPRGRGKAPKSVVAQGEIDPEELKQQIVKARSFLRSIESLPTKSNFPHPYFGTLNLKMTIKFLKLHTIHHLKIIRDIKK